MRGIGSLGSLRGLLVACWVAGSVLLAQVDSGTIVGTVTDATGGIVPGATVRVTNVATNIGFTVTTGADGAYATNPLRIGVYDVIAESTGFKTSVREGINLRVQDRLEIDFTLEIGDVTETVEVTAAEPLLQTQTSSLGQVMETRAIEDLPLNGRSYIQLITLAAGAFVPQPLNSIWVDFVAINGNRAMQNTFLLDGVNNNTTDNSNPAIIPPPDAIAEFKVQGSSMSAEFGRSAGGAINVSIKSGANEFHGNLFEFMRNDSLDANTFFNAGRKKPHFRQNQFGGTLGGPIVKNRTFFFGDIQWTRLRRGRTDNVRTIDPPERTGDFSHNANTIFNPFTNQTLPDGNTTRDPFVDNRVPPSLMSAVAQRVVALYPQPNSSGAQNFVGNSVLQSNVLQYDIRLDHRFSDQDSFFWRGSMSNQDHINPGSFETVASGRFRFPSTGTTPGRGIASGWTHIWSPKVVSDVRFGFARLAWFGDVATPDRYGASELGIPGVPEGPQQVGLPGFTVAGLEYLGDQGLLPVVRGKNVFNYLGNVTITEGRHSFKAGFDMRATQFNINQPGGPRGNWTFNGVFTNQPNAPSGTGSGVADLLLGYAQGASIANSQTVGTRIRQYNWYFLDDWKATDRLTINWGLRYELTTPPYEAYDRALSFDFDKGEIVFAKPGSWRDRAFTDLAKNNFAPRLGFAYQLTESSVVRAGYGIFWAFEDNGTFLPMFNFPFRFTATFPSDQVNPSSALRLDTGFPENALTEFVPAVQGLLTRDFNLRPAYIQQWNFTLERQWGDVLLSAAYVGNKGTHLARLIMPNNPEPGPGPLGPRRPYPEFSTMHTVESSGNSIYHGLLVKAEKRFSKGLSFLASYTYSKAIEDSGSPFLDITPTSQDRPQDSRRLDLERGLSPHDVRHRFVLSNVYDLPWGRNRRFLTDASKPVDFILGGWQLNGISTLQGGRPFTVFATPNVSNTGGCCFRADALRDPHLSRSQRSVSRWFDTEAFALPQPFTFGNAGRNSVFGPGQVNFDISFFKNFYLNPDATGNFRPNEVQFRMEFFNIFNTPQFQAPNSTFGTPQFGTISNLVYIARQIQFALKFRF